MAGTTILLAPPNWDSPVVDRWSWLTEVHTARDGSEYRAPLRDAPRRTTRWQTAAAHDALRQLDADLWGWRGGDLQLPVWRDAVRLDGPLSSGSSAVAVSRLSPAARWDFAPGRGAVLVDPMRETCELVEVATVADGALTLAAPTTTNWPAGSRIVPTRAGRPVSATRRYVTGGHAYVDVEVEWTDLDTSPADTITAPGATYRGRPLDTRRPDRSTPMGGQLARVVSRVDGDVGGWVADDRLGRPAAVRTLEYALVGREAVAGYLATLLQLQGRAVAHWAPTWQADLRLTSPVLAGATSVAVAAVGYMDRYALRQGRRDIALWHRPTRTLYARRVLLATSGAGVETLTLDSTIPVGGAASDWIVSWLELVRLDSDEVEIAWERPELARVAVAVREIPVGEASGEAGYVLTEAGDYVVTEAGERLLLE